MCPLQDNLLGLGNRLIGWTTRSAKNNPCAFDDDLVDGQATMLRDLDGAIKVTLSECRGATRHQCTR